MKNGKMNSNIVQSTALMELETDVIVRHTEVSEIDTPAYYIKEQQGFDYVDEAYMRHMLNTHFPIWKWEIIKYEFIGDKVISVHGRLTIVDSGVERHFDAIDAHRVMTSTKTGDYVDIGNDMKSANSDCFKVAVNRLCNIADDVYRKRIEDISLEPSQLKAIKDSLKNLKDEKTVAKIESGIEKMTINRTNYEATMKKITTLIGER
tara:strand:+ start:386 stop:1003 length:618 start_codon:yes stop_codon:yes gene_type:complete